ncbi:MAG: polymerase protein [Candidatus Nomurabacteria bacterium GW2011_GWB1_37_5]|uniref:DNA-directed DNA polymerase n=1 Tax=Candidatus Nomurabacteria bacterium GW2011_GWB1_37_5 TaxID=1618742 RepID=A0A0G0JGJ9_9BACT|nr:MAG: polymerase protein [Candidatus Nomurabacteria bacterium GW2011_GWB1_37_5]
MEKIFKELEFKSLIDRAKKLFLQEETKIRETPGVGASLTPGVEENFGLKEPDKEEIKKIGIALWLLSSENTNPTFEDILSYANTSSFMEAKDKILKEIDEKKLKYVYEEIELPLLPIIKKAEERGVLLNVEYLKDLSKEYKKKSAIIEKEIYKLSGQDFNINSPKQLSEILYSKLNLSSKGLKKTAGGSLSTRESEIIKLRDQHPIIEKILEYRELQKLLSTYIDPLPGLVDQNNRLHTSLNQTGTTTGRMSSSNPNLQNIPIRGEFGGAIRKSFITTPGYKWVACDYSQIEMRVLALLSEDENLINFFKRGEDIHSGVASFVFGVPQDKVTGEMRRKAKTINFGIIYGMGVNALKASLGCSREEAQIFYNNYFEKFPKVKNYFDKIKQEAEKKGYTKTLFGRRRYFPALKSKLPFLKAGAERMAMNAPLQGTAADIIKIAMKKIDEEIKKNNLEGKFSLLLQVHDELIFEAEESVALEGANLIKRVMENAVESRIIFGANAYIGDNWAELKPVN